MLRPFSALKSSVSDAPKVIDVLAKARQTDDAGRWLAFHRVGSGRIDTVIRMFVVQ